MSGGERMRAALCAALFLGEADIRWTNRPTTSTCRARLAISAAGAVAGRAADRQP
ncbi:hypothetical protein M8494_28065 [Serratia ureilytica]